MSKPITEVCRNTVVKSIAEVEKNGPLGNRNELYQAVAKLYNRDKPLALKEISHSVIGLRVTTWNLEVKTPFGKKGRQAGVALTQEQKDKMQEGRANSVRVPRSEKLKAFAAEFTELRRVTPVSLHSTIDRIQGGSLKAAVRLNCLACSGDKIQEVKLCQVNDCPLYAFRPGAIPYKDAKRLGDKRDKESETETAAA